MAPDTIVVGAGVVGSALALRLAAAGQHVLVLDPEPPGSGASFAAGGILGPQIEAHGDGPVFRLGLASREAHQALAEELRDRTGIDVGFGRVGLLQVIFAGDNPAPLEARLAWQRAAGVPVESLSGDEARRLEPALAPAVARALHFPDEARLDPRWLAKALHQAAVRAGATFRTARVRRVRFVGERAVGVETEGAPLSAGATVIAAGAWSAGIAGAGLPEHAVVPVRGQLARLGPPPAGPGSWPGKVVFLPGGYLVPRADGTVLAGSTMERAGFERRVTAGGLGGILSRAARTVPALAEATVEETWSGLRPATPDDRPILGELRPGLFLCTGHGRGGILLAPETARLVADDVLGRPDRPALAPFDPARFGG
jgi:glycine oxidase